jgi:hypothetical protein
VLQDNRCMLSQIYCMHVAVAVAAGVSVIVIVPRVGVERDGWVLGVEVLL